SRHTTKTGEPKIVKECTFPLTGMKVVNTIYTDLAVIDVKEDGLFVRELAPGVTFEYVQERTGATLHQ
ncbi:MAG: CoA-transferase, partial [Bacteroidota bacterium]